MKYFSGNPEIEGTRNVNPDVETRLIWFPTCFHIIK